MIISANVDNSYMLFGFKETQLTLQRKVDSANVYAIESTTVIPQFEIYPPGIRIYTLNEWDEIAYGGTPKDFINFGTYVALNPGEVPI